MFTSRDVDSGTSLTGSFAPVYWGFVISLVLAGITIIQAYIYFWASKDRLIVRWTAWTMLILDIASSALIAQSVFHYLILHFGALSHFDVATREIAVECLLSTLITFNSQLFFIYQLYSVKRIGMVRWITIGSIFLFAVVAFAAGVACAIAMLIFDHGVFSNRNTLFSIFFGFAKGFGALTDILATTAMCIFLTSSMAGISGTNTLLNKLIRFLVHRAALVTLVQTLLLITFYAIPNRLYWSAFHFNVTKLYANTFFAMLNARQHLRKTLSSCVVSPNVTGDTYRDATPKKSTFQDRDCDPPHRESQSIDSRASMPTVTTTVVAEAV